MASDRKSSFTRRKVLKALGAGTIALSTTPAVIANSISSVEYPLLVSDDDVLEYVSVPEDWDEHRKHARSVLQQIREELHAIPSVVETQLEASTETYDGFRARKIVVLVSEEKSNTEVTRSGKRIPSKKDTVSIEKREMPEKAAGGKNCDTETTSDNCTNNTPISFPPGGYSFGDTNNDDGTSCCSVLYEGTKCMLTCAHLFGGSDNNKHCDNSRDEIIGTVADVNGIDVGKVIEYNKDEDWAVVDESEGGSYLNHIHDRDGNPVVKGYVTKTGLDAWNSNTDRSPCLENMGRITGHTTGKVQATDVSDTSICTDFNSNGVKTYCNFALGDSGSPSYYVNNGDAYLVSVTGYGYNLRGLACGNYLFSNGGGCGAYHIVDTNDIYFDP